MALSTNQQPFLATINKRIHSVYYPAHYTVESSVYTTAGMKYKFEINDVDGVVSATNNPPSYVNGLGIFNPNSILKNKVEHVFQPNILKFTPCKNAAIQYRIDVEEVGVTSPASTNFFKVWAMRNFDEAFNYEDYMCDGTDKKMLTKMETERDVTLSDRGTVRFFCGTLVNRAYTSYISRVYQFVVIKTDSSGNKYYYKSQANPYYSQTTNVGLQISNAIIESLDNYILDFPAYPWNINQMPWTYFAYKAAGGAYSQLPIPLLASNILSNASSYEIGTYCWPYGDNGYTSETIKFNIVDECGFVDEFVQLAWENEVGAIDYFTIKYAKTNTNSTEKSSFVKNKYAQGQMEGTYFGNGDYVGYNQYSRGESIYSGRISEQWTLNTGFLTKQQIRDLSFLYSSPNVYMRKGTTWYPVIVLNGENLVETDVRGLKNFEINVRLANKKYIG